MSSGGGTTASAGDNEMAKENPAGENINKDCVQFEAKENVRVGQEGVDKKSKDMPEISKMTKKMVGLPPINVAELSSILQHPSMPSQDLMKEVVNKIKIRNDKTDNKTASVNSVIDCIMEESLNHTHNTSDEEEEGEHEPFFIEISCDYCKKKFGSTMSMKTHVLMSHSKDDPSVLNRLRESIDEEKTSELSPTNTEGSNKATKSEKKEHSSSCKSSINPSIKSAQSSPRKKCVKSESTENVEIEKRRSSPDLKEAVSEFSTDMATSSQSPAPITSDVKNSGKRISSDSTPATSIKKSKRSQRSKSGESESESERESVHLRRSSRRK